MVNQIRSLELVKNCIGVLKMYIGDRVQTLNTLCPISGTVVEIYDNLIVISDDDAETDDDRLEFHESDLEDLCQ